MEIKYIEEPTLKKNIKVKNKNNFVVFGKHMSVEGDIFYKIDVYCINFSTRQKYYIRTNLFEAKKVFKECLD